MHYEKRFPLATLSRAIKLTVVDETDNNKISPRVSLDERDMDLHISPIIIKQSNSTERLQGSRPCLTVLIMLHWLIIRPGIYTRTMF